VSSLFAYHYPITGWLMMGYLVAGCATAPAYHNTLADVGARPGHYEQTIREQLNVSLKDPDSVKAFSVSEPVLAHCMIAPTYPFYGWRVATRYNAKNSYGAYVRLREYFYWFQGERIKLITSSPTSCPEGTLR
jgi:hypothetical protein